MRVVIRIMEHAPCCNINELTRRSGWSHVIMTVMIIHRHVIMAIVTIHRWHHWSDWIRDWITHNWICRHRHPAMIVIDHPIAIDIQLEE